MVCKNCFAENNDGAAFCTNCGAPLEAQPQAPVAEPVAPQYEAPQQYAAPVQQPYAQPAYQPAPQVAPKAPQPGKGLAIAAMVCGIVSFFCFGVILGILAIVFGGIAKSKGCKSGMATAGIVCGAVGLGLWLLSLIFLGGGLLALGF